MLQKVKTSLRKMEALPIQERLHLQITLAILDLANPNSKQINKLANKLNIPLLGFQTFDELASYLEAVIRSGTSEEEKNGTVFFMGNTEQHWVLRFEKHLIHIRPLPSPIQAFVGNVINVFPPKPLEKFIKSRLWSFNSDVQGHLQFLLDSCILTFQKKAKRKSLAPRALAWARRALQTLWNRS